VTVFVVVAAAMVLVALLFVVPPLLGRTSASDARRDQILADLFRGQVAALDLDERTGAVGTAERAGVRAEMERALLDEAEPEAHDDMAFHVGHSSGRWAAAVVALAVPVVAIGMYWSLAPHRLGTGEASAFARGVPQVEAMVARLEKKMTRQPDNAEGWIMLGRSYLVLHRYPNSAKAFGHAYSLLGSVPDVMVDYAEALSMAHGASMAGKPSELVEKVLATDPNNIKALWLAGAAAYQRGELPMTLKRWHRVLALLPVGSKDATTVRATIARVSAERARRRQPKAH